jgi:hypothetical protein
MKNKLSVKESLYIIIGSLGVFVILICQAFRQELFTYSLRKTSIFDRNKNTNNCTKALINSCLGVTE